MGSLIFPSLAFGYSLLAERRGELLCPEGHPGIHSRHSQPVIFFKSHRSPPWQVKPIHFASETAQGFSQPRAALLVHRVWNVGLPDFKTPVFLFTYPSSGRHTALLPLVGHCWKLIFTQQTLNECLLCAGLHSRDATGTKTGPLGAYILVGEAENKQANKYVKQIVGCDECSEENKQSADAKNTQSCLYGRAV